LTAIGVPPVTTSVVVKVVDRVVNGPESTTDKAIGLGIDGVVVVR
jgi:hypothetical protein